MQNQPFSTEIVDCEQQKERESATATAMGSCCIHLHTNNIKTLIQRRFLPPHRLQQRTNSCARCENANTEKKQKQQEFMRRHSMRNSYTKQSFTFKWILNEWHIKWNFKRSNFCLCLHAATELLAPFIKITHQHTRHIFLSCVISSAKHRF